MESGPQPLGNQTDRCTTTADGRESGIYIITITDKFCISLFSGVHKLAVLCQCWKWQLELAPLRSTVFFSCKCTADCVQWKLWVACGQQYRWSHCPGRYCRCLVPRQDQTEQMPRSSRRLTFRRSTAYLSTPSCLSNGRASSKGEGVRSVCFWRKVKVCMYTCD